MIKNLAKDFLSIFFLWKKLFLKEHPKDEKFSKIDEYPFWTVWQVKETYNSILVDEYSYVFFQVTFHAQSLNIFVHLMQALPWISVSINIVQVPSSEVHSQIKKTLNRLEEERIEMFRKGIANTGFIEKDMKHIEEYMHIVASQENIPFAKCFVMIPAIYKSKMIKLLGSLSRVNLLPLFFEQLCGLKSFLWHNPGLVKTGDMLVNSAAIDPFRLAIYAKPHDIFIGKDKQSDVAIFEDFFAYENYNSVIIAKSGAGKSFLAKQLIRRMLVQGYAIYIFDPENEYLDLVKNFQGNSFTSSEMSCIDKYMEMQDNVAYIKEMLPILCANDLESISLVMDDIDSYKQLQKRFPEISTKYVKQLHDVIYPRRRGVSLLEHNLLHFYELSENNLHLSLYKLMKFLLLQQKEKRLLFIDEAHKVLDDEYLVKYIRQLVKRGRKYGLGVVIITQDLLDAMQHSWGRSILTNATFKFLLKQEQVAVPLIEKTFGIHGYDTYLSNASVGEGLFIVGEVVKKVIFEDM